MLISFKVYEYKNYKAYYLTLNGIQFGPIHFSEAQINASIAKLITGENL